MSKDSKSEIPWSPRLAHELRTLQFAPRVCGLDQTGEMRPAGAQGKGTRDCPRVRRLSPEISRLLGKKATKSSGTNKRKGQG